MGYFTTLSRGLAGAAACALAVGLTAGPAVADTSQTPTTTACPAGYEVLNLEALPGTEGDPYVFPYVIDRAGNNDGLVCGLALPDAFRDAECRNAGGPACDIQAAGLPIYHLMDNSIPAGDTAAAGA
jgi:hypothetical protein